MRTLALTSLLALLASCSFTWQGQNAGISAEEAAQGIKSPETLARAYENQKYWRAVRRNMDGLTNALSRDLTSIGQTFDRHFFSYSPTDPYVNHATEENYWSTLWSHAGSFASTFALPMFPTR